MTMKNNLKQKLREEYMNEISLFTKFQCKQLINHVEETKKVLWQIMEGSYSNDKHYLFTCINNIDLAYNLLHMSLHQVNSLINTIGIIENDTEN